MTLHLVDVPYDARAFEPHPGEPFGAILPECMDWLDEQCGPYARSLAALEHDDCGWCTCHSDTRVTFVFVRQQHAVLFKLTWGGKSV